MPETAIIMFGMHRSGTSALAGSLEEAGVFMGHVVRACADNPRGWCENPVVFTMHEDILRMNGGAWYSPPEVCLWHPNHELMRDTIIDAFRGHPFWGFKDPRTLFTLEGWLKVLPHAQPVAIFRHPRLVTDSLNRRNSFPHAKGMAIWAKYNLKLLRWHEQLRFPVISFDDLDLTFEEQLRRTIDSLGLPRQPRAFRFYESRFRHTQLPREEALPVDVEDIYESLKAIYRETTGKMPARQGPDG